MKKVTTIALVLVLVASYPVFRVYSAPQKPESKHLIMRCYDGTGLLELYFGNGETDIKRYKSSERPNGGMDNIVIDLLNKYHDQGYRLVSTDQQDATNSESIVTTYYLAKP